VLENLKINGAVKVITISDAANNKEIQNLSKNITDLVNSNKNNEN